MKIELTQVQAFVPLTAFAKIEALQTMHLGKLSTVAMKAFAGHAHLPAAQINDGRHIQTVLLNLLVA